MAEIGFPAIANDVRKVVGPRHLIPWTPRTSWDGWFAIAIFPAGSEIRWLKAHFYYWARGKGRYPLAAVEGFGDSSEMMIAWATAESVEVLSSGVGGEAVESSESPLWVRMDDLFLLEGAAPRYGAKYSLPDARAEATFSFEAGWPLWWSRFGRLLTYAGQHSSVAVDLECERLESHLEGFGVLEHVTGASVPFDFTRSLGLGYHWDVLAFHTPGSPFDSAAGLSIIRRGKTVVRLKAAASLPGGRPEAMYGLSVRYLEQGRGAGSGGEKIAVPLRWEGVMRNRAGTFSYTATATTPVAAVIPGGGMLGFEFDGEWVSRAAPVERFSGTGFTEYGDFSGRRSSQHQTAE